MSQFEFLPRRIRLRAAIRNMLAFFAQANPPVSDHLPVKPDILLHRRESRQFRDMREPRTKAIGWQVLRSTRVATRRDYVGGLRRDRRLAGFRAGGRRISRSRNEKIVAFAAR